MTIKNVKSDIEQVQRMILLETTGAKERNAKWKDNGWSYSDSKRIC